MYKLTDEQRREIRETIGVIEEDLKTFLESTGQDELTISNISIKGIVSSNHDNWYLKITSTRGINIINAHNNSYNGNQNYRLDTNYPEQIDDIRLRFIGNYEEIREVVAKFCEEKYGDRNTYLETMQEIKDKYTKKVDVGLDLPPSTDRYQLEINEVDGKKIGSIDLGKKIVQIVTEGDIVLVQGDTKDVPKINVKQL